jgi:hypothetical protein
MKEWERETKAELQRLAECGPRKVKLTTEEMLTLGAVMAKVEGTYLSRFKGIIDKIIA